MKRIPFYSPLCMLCAALVVLAACGKESDNTLPNSPLGTEALRVQATRLGFVEEDGKTRATTDDATMRTTFESGDAIGIFAVKGGVVQTDCKNLKLTMQPDGSWGGNTVFFTEGTTYFAYSPYRDVAGINSAVSIDNIAANFTISNDQSTAALYAANDLMTSTTCTANKAEKTLTITFEHRFALLEMERAYCKGKGAAYPLNNTVPCELHMMDLPEGTDNVVIGYRKGSIMRFLLKPGSRSIAPVFQQSDMYLTFYTTPNPLLNLTQGRRFKLKPQKKRDVQVGDYYYSDGSVFLQEWTKAGLSNSSGRIGIVYNTQMAANDGSRQWKNGYVMSAERLDATDISWKEAGAISGNTYHPNWSSIIAMSTSGYDEYLKIKSLSISSKFPFVLAAETLSSPPAGTSGWYLPSVSQLAHLMRNIGNSPDIYITEMENWRDSEYAANFARVNAVFQRFSSPFENEVIYTTSTEADKDRSWFFKSSYNWITTQTDPAFYHREHLQNGIRRIHSVLMF